MRKEKRTKPEDRVTMACQGGRATTTKAKSQSERAKVQRTRNHIKKTEAPRKTEETSRLRFSKVEHVTWARYVAMLARDRGSGHLRNDGAGRKKARGHQGKTETRRRHENREVHCKGSRKRRSITLGRKAGNNVWPLVYDGTCLLYTSPSPRDRG